MDMSALTGVFAGLNYARGVFQGLLKATVALETHAQIDEALEKLGQAQATMFEMHRETPDPDEWLRCQLDGLEEPLS